jgi:hypothetical protein
MGIPLFGFGRPKDRNQQDNAADHHARIGKIEGGPPGKTEEAVEIHADKIHYPIGSEDPVRQVTDAPAKDSRHNPALEGGKFVGFEIIEYQENQYDEGNDDKQDGPDKIGEILPQAKGNGLIPHVDYFQKLVTEDILNQGVLGPIFHDQELGELIRQDQKGGKQKGQDLGFNVGFHHSYSVS